MGKIKSTINLLKTMLYTSYDMSYLIDDETNKINKKSTKLWLVIAVGLLVAYLSNFIVGKLVEIGGEGVFLEIFFLVLQVLVMFQTILLGLSVMYSSDDIHNYLHLPISNIKLLFTKFAVMMSIILGTEITIVFPSLFIYGIKVIDNILAYSILLILILFLSSIFIASICIIVMIPIMRLCRFIKNKYWYQSIVVVIMTCMMIMPITNSMFNVLSDGGVQVQENVSYNEEEEKNQDKQQISMVNSKINQLNKSFIVGELGVQALAQCNSQSVLAVLKILGLDIIVLTVLTFVGRKTYIKDVLWILSLFDKKNNHKINLKKRCKERNKNRAYITNDIKDILKNSTFFMHYIYNVLILLTSIVGLGVLVVSTLKQYIIENVDTVTLSALTFDFEIFSIIIGIIQLICMISPISLTAMSRYGKNAIFFKHIPIKQNTQFRLKNIPQITINTIIITVVLITLYYLFPEIQIVYILSMFIVAMLLNIIYSYILLLIDLKRPQLNNESEISVIQQNDNKLFKYIVTAIIGVILWYIYQITKEISINIAILVEIGLFSFIILILEIIINKKRDKLFEKIY